MKQIQLGDYIVEIHSDSKYILKISDEYSPEEVHHIEKLIHNWYESKTQPILILHGKIELVQIDQGEGLIE